ncbi:MAG: hypothetical protein ACI4JS_10535, partial [Oscillospiraceae bacterium]
MNEINTENYIYTAKKDLAPMPEHGGVTPAILVDEDDSPKWTPTNSTVEVPAQPAPSNATKVETTNWRQQQNSSVPQVADVLTPPHSFFYEATKTETTNWHQQQQNAVNSSVPPVAVAVTPEVAVADDDDSPKWTPTNSTGEVPAQPEPSNATKVETTNWRQQQNSSVTPVAVAVTPKVAVADDNDSPKWTPTNSTGEVPAQPEPSNATKVETQNWRQQQNAANSAETPVVAVADDNDSPKWTPTNSTGEVPAQPAPSNATK